jgi:hypothetical protein
MLRRVYVFIRLGLRPCVGVGARARSRARMRLRLRECVRIRVRAHISLRARMRLRPGSRVVGVCAEIHVFRSCVHVTAS